MSTEAMIQEAGRIREQAREEFVRLARRVALGEPIEPPEIASVCRDAGKEADEFASLVRSLRQRAQLRIQAAARAEVEKGIADIERRINEETETLERAVVHRNETVYPLHEQWKVLTKQLAEIRCVPGDLANTCPDPVLNAEAKRLRIESATLQQQQRDAAVEVDRLQGQLNQLDPNHEQHGRFLRAIERAKTALAEIDKRIAETERRIAENWQQRIDF